MLINTNDVEAALAGAAQEAPGQLPLPDPDARVDGRVGRRRVRRGADGDGLVATQGVYPLRDAIAHRARPAQQNVHVIYVEGSGCYGLNGADNVALDAAVISQQVGKPVRVQYMRADEHKWENYGQPFCTRCAAAWTRTATSGPGTPSTAGWFPAWLGWSC